jgi:pyruvate/2-oxoglutarate dehydrogenase complex dihydrolipoamide dehydrogenase (E3) component
MTEERTTGGTCVNRGCLPSKNLIEAARLVYNARNPETCIDSFFKDVKTTVLLRRLRAAPVPTRYTISEAQPAHA